MELILKVLACMLQLQVLWKGLISSSVFDLSSLVTEVKLVTWLLVEFWKSEIKDGESIQIPNRMVPLCSLQLIFPVEFKEENLKTMNYK